MGAAAVLGATAAAMLCFLGLLTNPINDLDVIVEYGSDDGNHVGLYDPGPDSLCASNSYVDNTLKRQIPLPHVHHVFAATLLEDAD